MIYFIQFTLISHKKKFKYLIKQSKPFMNLIFHKKKFKYLIKQSKPFMNLIFQMLSKYLRYLENNTQLKKQYQIKTKN